LWPCAAAAVTACLIGVLTLTTHMWVLGLGVVPASYIVVLAVLNSRFRSTV
jgi:hypothetical protein